MTAASLLAAGTLLVLAGLLVFAATAELDPPGRFWPTSDNQSGLLLSLLAVGCGFVAGLVL